MKMLARHLVGAFIFSICLLLTFQIACADVIVPPKYYNKIRFVVGNSTMYINQKATAMGASPFILEGRAYVPVRYLLEAIGMADDKISWDPSSQGVRFPYRTGAPKEAPYYVIRIGDPGVYGDGTQIAGSMNAPTLLKGGRVFVPVRLVVDYFNCSVSWNADEQSVTINAPVF